jgi:hypothetical protein
MNDAICNMRIREFLKILRPRSQTGLKSAMAKAIGDGKPQRQRRLSETHAAHYRQIRAIFDSRRTDRT